MRDDKLGIVGALQGVDAVADDFERVNVQAGIGFVEDGELGFEHGHLENLRAFFFAAGETFVDGALEQIVLQFQQFHFVPHEREKFNRVEFLLALVLADFIQRGLEKVSAVHAGNLDRILEREEQAFARTFLGIEIEQVFAVIKHFAAGDVVTITARQDGGQRAFAAAVRPHDGVDFARIDGEADALEDLFALDASGEVFDFENRLLAHL